MPDGGVQTDDGLFFRCREKIVLVIGDFCIARLF